MSFPFEHLQRIKSVSFPQNNDFVTDLLKQCFGFILIDTDPDPGSSCWIRPKIEKIPFLNTFFLSKMNIFLQEWLCWYLYEVRIFMSVKQVLFKKNINITFLWFWLIFVDIFMILSWFLLPGSGRPKHCF